MNERAIVKAFFEWLFRLINPPSQRSRWALGPNSGVDVGVGLKGVLGAGTGQIYFAADRIHGDGRTERQRFISSYLTAAVGLGAEIPNVTFSAESFPSEGAIFYGMKADDFRAAGDFCGQCLVIQLGGGLIVGAQATTICLGLSRNTRAYVASAVAFGEQVRRAWRERRLTFEMLQKMVNVVRTGWAVVRDGTLWRGQIRSRGAIAGIQAGVGLQLSYGVVEAASGVALPTSSDSVQAGAGASAVLGRAAAGMSGTVRSVRTKRRRGKP